MTVEELIEETNISEAEIWKVFNNLDIKSYEYNGESRWHLTHLATYPLLVTLTMTSSFFK